MTELDMRIEIDTLSRALKILESVGKDGACSTRWYADIKVIIDSRITELQDRISAAMRS